ncbi:MAG TPA: MFS transporter, partial [Sphingomicrobium sp.]|nr:MFS transporter [Sphingomicrobium sp.]
GAIIFGAMGDRIGRKATFLATVSLMGGATFGIGLLPTYAQAGAIAPILLILLRICQGTALGGEYGGAAIYVAEHADDDKRGAATGWIQSSASFGLLAALMVIFVTRRALGEESFDAWGWRIPFLVSVVLLAISVWMRVKLSESPAFAKLREEGQVSKAPLREAFANRSNLRQVAIAFFAIMCAQGAVWYFTFFYMQVFLEKSLGLPGATKDLLLIIMTLASAPLYVFFGWLSDRWGRKPVMLFGMLLALLLYFPGSHWIAVAANPGLMEAQRSSPVVVYADPATCTAQFDPTGTQKFLSGCDTAKALLVAKGVNFTSVAIGSDEAQIMIGKERLAFRSLAELPPAAAAAEKAEAMKRLTAALQANGYPASADPARMNWPVLVGVLLLFVVAATALYGPQAAALVEMFPTRIRYSAMSLPYHFGTGWVGGFLPFTSFAIVALTGDIYAGLWYSVIFTAISVVTTLFFLNETAGKPID